MQRRCFADDGANGRARIEQGFDVGVIVGAAVDAASGTESRYQRVLPLHIFSTIKEFCVFGIRPGPAAFNKCYAKLIELAGDLDLVFARKRDAFALCAVAQSGVIDLNHGDYSQSSRLICGNLFFKLQQITQLIHTFKQTRFGKTINGE